MKTCFNPFAVAVPATARIPAPQPKPARPVKPAQPRKRVRAKRIGQSGSDAAAEEALARAQAERSLANYPTIIQAFSQRGIPVDQIQPRENVLTFRAWLAKGRAVRKGEKGVRIATIIPAGEKETVDPETGEVSVALKTRPWHATVFHISQTDPIAAHHRTPVAQASQPAGSEASSLAPTRPPSPVHRPPSPLTRSWMKYATLPAAA